MFMNSQAKPGSRCCHGIKQPLRKGPITSVAGPGSWPPDGSCFWAKQNMARGLIPVAFVEAGLHGAYPLYALPGQPY
ncbi:hypothetical protein AAFF_G00115980 [Aldrovandia affinis]|uniref:Uncharacterized protein n=1 Tax=Aldrovandia affinis TaxID=143900 RepID=A0AAD7WXB3_9TELE|nr:hypothetical protein AAFF_G00115980 [Aldrovandia affinis]